MPKNLKEDRTSHSERRIIRQIGGLLACLACSLFLANCGFIVAIGNAPTAYDSYTEKLTEYRRSFIPLKTEYTETTCTHSALQGTVEIASQEYLCFQTHDFANWDWNSKGITYLLPRQGNGPALIQTTNSPVQNRQKKPVGIVFDLDGKLSQANLESQQKEKIDFYLVRLETDTKLSSRKPDILLYICATRSGEGTRIALFTRKNAKWDLSGSYVVEQPIHKNPWRIDTWRNIALSAGYVVTVPTDMVLTTVGLVLLPSPYYFFPVV
ncbi:MAG TPA: hypothetical protein PLA90_13375 [Candidatus Sumerlaeota bacterium]|nr:hypothetical protein [Candidatus Sumerlaeota bacterium]